MRTNPTTSRPGVSTSEEKSTGRIDQIIGPGTVDRQVKSNPRNNLIHGRHRCGKGRNSRGIITARHRGGGHKRLYRKIDFRRNQKDISGAKPIILYL